MPTFLNDMPLERANEVVLHPLHQATYAVLPQLIADLRMCRSDDEYYNFQEDLYAKVYDIHQYRAECRRVQKRLQAGRSVPINAPSPRGGGAVGDEATWQLEIDVCERVDRQLRSIGDALAWRLFNYDRRVMIAFSRNDLPGYMVPKEGHQKEIDYVRDMWRDAHELVLLNDLTTCLRSNDVMRFVRVGTEFEVYAEEIKTNPARQQARQVARSSLAQDAIRVDGPLPDDRAARFVAVDIPYKTHLAMLRDAFGLAARRGVIGMKVPGGRALLAADLGKGYSLWSEEEFLERSGGAIDQARKRAGIAGRTDYVYYGSDDQVARTPIQPPWAIYPLSPVACASLIVDMAFFMVTVSGASLVEALEAEGIRAEWVLPAGQERLKPGQTLLRAYRGNRGIEMRPSDMQRLALELVDLSTWVATVDALLSLTEAPGRPWPYYRDEYETWV